MPTFGPVLKQKREQRRMSLDDIARETRLSKRYLVALEDEDISKLPGGAYNRAYLRMYATHLGLDPDPLLRQYSDEEAHRVQSAEDHLTAMNRALEQRSFFGLAVEDAPTTSEGIAGRAIGSVITLTLLAGLTWFALSGFEAASTESRVVAAPTPPESAGNAKSSPEPNVAVPPVGLASRVAAAAAVAGMPRLVVDEFGVAAASTNDDGGDDGGDPRDAQPSRLVTGQKAVFWTHVQGGRAGDIIDHLWLRDGIIVDAISLTVGDTDGQTRSQRVLDTPGAWVVEARDAEGRTLARHQLDTLAP